MLIKFYFRAIATSGPRLPRFSTSSIESLILTSMFVQHTKITNVKTISRSIIAGCPKNGGGCRCFCNPPYSQIGDWVKKAYFESFTPGTLIVLLIPARTDTKYFHEYILNRSEIRFIKGRLKFGSAKNSAPFPSMIVIYRAGGLTD